MIRSSLLPRQALSMRMWKPISSSAIIVRAAGLTNKPPCGSASNCRPTDSTPITSTGRYPSFSWKNARSRSLEQRLQPGHCPLATSDRRNTRLNASARYTTLTICPLSAENNSPPNMAPLPNRHQGLIPLLPTQPILSFRPYTIDITSHLIEN